MARTNRRWRSATSLSTTDFFRILKNTAVFVQDELTILKRFILSGGLRYDINEPYQDELTGRAGAVVLIDEIGMRVRGAWGQGFRAPTINDLFFPGAGNPDLQPEESTSWEIGLDQKLWQGRIRLGATYFNTRFTNLIDFDLVTFQPVNVGRARAQGVEFAAEMDVLDWLVAYVNYTFTDTENLDTGDPLRRFARNMVNAGMTAEPVRRLNVYAQLYVVSDKFETCRVHQSRLRWRRTSRGPTRSWTGAATGRDSACTRASRTCSTSATARCADSRRPGSTRWPDSSSPTSVVARPPGTHRRCSARAALAMRPIAARPRRRAHSSSQWAERTTREQGA